MRVTRHPRAIHAEERRGERFGRSKIVKKREIGVTRVSSNVFNSGSKARKEKIDCVCVYVCVSEGGEDRERVTNVLAKWF